MVTLTADEVQRYKRHLVLRDVGAPGQQKLKAARVLVVGAGGLGSPVLMYLAAAGVGTIGVIDDDRVSIDNLQRQIAHREEDVGRLKVESARDAVARINPLVNVETIAERLEPANALDIIGRYDIVADGSDNFATRYLVSDACYFAKRPLAYAALGSFDGYVSLFKPHENDAGGMPYPTLRCVFPEAAAAGPCRQLRRGRRSRACRRRRRNLAGDRGRQGNPWPRGKLGRTAADLRRAGDAGSKL